MIRVLIVDDLKIVCEGLKAIFTSENDIKIVGIAHNGQEAIDQIPQLQPDVVILDLLMPVMDGTETTKKIYQQFPDVKILILSSYDDESVVSEVLAAGANGYLLKDMITEELVQAIRSVHQGASHFAPGILNTLAKNALQNVDPQSLSMIPNKVCTIDPRPAAQAKLAAVQPAAQARLAAAQPVAQARLLAAQPATQAATVEAKVAKPTAAQAPAVAPKSTATQAATVEAKVAKPTAAQAPAVEPKSTAAQPKVEAKVVKPAAAQPTAVAAKPAAAKAKKVKNPKPEKPLFPYGDWAIVVVGIIVLSQTNGMGHHLGHAGLFLLMLALIARPLRATWDSPLKHRRAVGIFAFAATVAHAIYATLNVLEGNLGMVLSMSPIHQWGMWAGVVSLAVMTPAAITSFQSFQRKLGKQWRQIHLLTIPALTLAVLHTILIGPDYMAEFEMQVLDHVRSYGIIAISILVLLIRKRIILSGSKTNKISKNDSGDKKPKLTTLKQVAQTK